ncbi:MAG TPA: peptidyl-prolyl cis-trans isomerase, partial [Sphingomicrobium sp.]
GSFGQSSGALAEVGDEEITDRDVSNAMRRALEQARQQNPEADYAAIAGQFDPILNSMIDERALVAFASDHGFNLSKRLVDAEIASLPQTRGLDGRFSEQAYAGFLQQQQMTDADVRQVLRTSMTQRLVLAPAVVDARVPIGIARPYASMLLEEREGQFALVPTEAFRAGLNPSDGDLQSFYAQNRNRYMVPEQRVLRLARIGPDLVEKAGPTDAEIAAYYKANRADYAGSEQRVISQAVVQDKAAADAIAARARGGASFVAAAAPAGLSAEDVSVGPQTRAEFTSLAGESVAGAAFSAARGAIIGPVRSDLGWHVIKIDDIQVASGRSLAQVRDEIAAALASNKRKDALTELVTTVEERIDDGASLVEAAAAARLAVTTTPAINAAGQSRTDADYRFPAELQAAMKAGFAMAADDSPEVVTLEGDAGYVVVAVERIIEAAPAPLAEIRQRVREDWIQRKANERAQAVAAEIAKKVAGGVAIEKATADAGNSLPPVRPIKAQRIQIGQVPPEAAAPLRMLFSLTQGKSRMVADPQGRGFFIVKANKITPRDASTNPTLIARTQSEFQSTVSDELALQMLVAMKADQGVTRNEKAIAAARQRITGTGQ